jgi:hypothetical protein
MPYFDLLSALLKEVEAIRSLNGSIVEESEKKLSGYKKTIKQLLLVKQQLDRKEEISRLKEIIMNGKTEISKQKHFVSIFPLRIFPLRIFALRIFPLRIFPLRIFSLRIFSLRISKSLLTTHRQPKSSTN